MGDLHIAIYIAKT